MIFSFLFLQGWLDYDINRDERPQKKKRWKEAWLKDGRKKNMHKIRQSHKPGHWTSRNHDLLGPNSSCELLHSFRSPADLASFGKWNIFSYLLVKISVLLGFSVLRITGISMLMNCTPTISLLWKPMVQPKLLIYIVVAVHSLREREKAYECKISFYFYFLSKCFVGMQKKILRFDLWL